MKIEIKTSVRNGVLVIGNSYDYIIGLKLKLDGMQATYIELNADELLEAVKAVSTLAKRK